MKTKESNSVKGDKYEADLEEALNVAGIGWYNLKFSAAYAMMLVVAIIEMISYSLVLPAAVCDLDMSNGQRGLVASIPFIGIITTSFPWGYLVDTRGRRKMVVYSGIAAGLFSILSGLMPDLTSYAVCKVLTSLFLASPTSVPYAYIGEIIPSKYRDLILSIVTATQISGAGIAPVLAWGIIPLDFRIQLGSLVFRSWRLLTIVYSSMFIIATILIALGPESPKFLVSRGFYDEALKVLQKIYAGNKNKRPEDFPIKKLIVLEDNKQRVSFLQSLKVQTVPLLHWRYMKWMLLNGFLLFGVFAIINGLSNLIPDVLNKVLTGSQAGMTACQIVSKKNDQILTDAICDDTLDNLMFAVSTVARVAVSVVAILISSTVQFIGKKNLLVTSLFTIGTMCILMTLITNGMLFAVVLSSTALMVLSMGPINAYTLEIIPTHLRGMAVSLTMMLGRIGSIITTTVAAMLVNNQCELMFYLFGGLLILCGALSLLLPTAKKLQRKDQNSNTNNCE